MFVAGRQCCRRSSIVTFDDADGVEGLEFVEGEAEGVGRIGERLEEVAQARQTLGGGERVHVRQAGRLEQPRPRPCEPQGASCGQ
jgi:hypothetical protein